MTSEAVDNVHPELPVILGATLLEARYWKGVFAATMPELANAREFSAHQTRALDGVRLTKLYVAPGAEKAPNYKTVMLVMDYSLRKTPGSQMEPIYLHSNGAL